METKTSSKTGTGKDVYTIVTEKIIEQLEKGCVPWRQPWTDAGIPMNLISKRPYRGINLLLLAFMGYERNLFLTSKQLNDIGGSLKPNEHPHIVVFCNYITKDKEKEDEENNKEKKKPFLRYYTVFNIAQCEGIPEKYIPALNSRETHPIFTCEKVIDDMPNKPKIQNKTGGAYYDVLRDVVNMPKQATFESDESYYRIFFHELIHSTGHKARLNRNGVIEMSEFGSEPYSQEELVAEIGTCYLQSYTGIHGQFEQSVSYIEGWLIALKNDKKFIFTAATNAQKATDYILNVQPETEEHEISEN